MIINYFSLYFFISQCFAAIVSGHVYDSKSNLPIANANLYIISQKVGSASQDDGSFIFSYSTENEVIEALTALGYSTVEVSVAVNAIPIEDELSFEEKLRIALEGLAE